jgi:hypothetical protein
MGVNTKTGGAAVAGSVTRGQWKDVERDGRAAADLDQARQSREQGSQRARGFAMDPTARQASVEVGAAEAVTRSLRAASLAVQSGDARLWARLRRTAAGGARGCNSRFATL